MQLKIINKRNILIKTFDIPMTTHIRINFRNIKKISSFEYSLQSTLHCWVCAESECYTSLFELNVLFFQHNKNVLFHESIHSKFFFYSFFVVVVAWFMLLIAIIFYSSIFFVCKPAEESTDKLNAEITYYDFSFETLRSMYHVRVSEWDKE